MAAASKATALANTSDMPVPEAPVRSAEIVAFQPPMRPALERVAEIARHIAVSHGPSGEHSSTGCDTIHGVPSGATSSACTITSSDEFTTSVARPFFGTRQSPERTSVP